MTRRRCFFLLFLAPAFGSKSLWCPTLTSLAEHLFWISRQPVLLHMLAWSCSGSIDLKPPQLQTNRKPHESTLQATQVPSEKRIGVRNYEVTKLFWLLLGVESLVRFLARSVQMMWCVDSSCLCYGLGYVWTGRVLVCHSSYLLSACEAKTGRQICCRGQLESLDPSTKITFNLLYLCGNIFIS